MMTHPHITIQLGQCGNQLGPELMSLVWDEAKHHDEDAARDVIDCYFRADAGHAISRSVLVDTEPRVVRGAASVGVAARGWRFDSSMIVCRQSGAANNWAHGFAMAGPVLCDDMLDAVRREVEMADAIGGFSVIQSLAGGTGSGLGACA